MGYISSINFKKSKEFQVFHNATVRPDYAIGGELNYNLKGYEALKLKNEIIENAKNAYNAQKSPKAPPFKAKSYEWSAVCNLKPESTMEDLEKLATHFREKYGFQCYQIAIHRDEGHINELGEKVINHHAHLEFITLDAKTGKNNFRREFITPKVLRQIQSEVAEILQMERGVDKRLSGVKRIEPRKYAIMKEKEKAQRAKDTALNNDLKRENAELKEKNEELKREIHLTKAQIKERIEQERKAWIQEQGHTKEEYAQLRSLNQQQYATITELEAKIKDLRTELEKEKSEQSEKIKNTEIPQDSRESKNPKLERFLKSLDSQETSKDDLEW